MWTDPSPPPTPNPADPGVVLLSPPAAPLKENKLKMITSDLRLFSMASLTKRPVLFKHGQTTRQIMRDKWFLFLVPFFSPLIFFFKLILCSSRAQIPCNLFSLFCTRCFNKTFRCHVLHSPQVDGWGVDGAVYVLISWFIFKPPP